MVESIKSQERQKFAKEFLADRDIKYVTWNQSLEKFEGLRESVT